MKIALRIVTLLVFILSISLPSLAASSTPAWKQNAVVYGVFPLQLSAGFNTTPLQAVRMRLPEIKKLGANILWLMPIFKSSEPGEGYDIVDYYKISPALGTEDDLRALVQSAHALGIHVILDVALNHTSVKHPFALDVAARGKDSSYYDFYQHKPIPGIPYSQFFHVKKIGKADFVYYFWEELVNLNYSNPKVQEYALDVLEYWVRKFDIDGYRLDASWGPASRWPGFYSAVRQRLRAIKPDIFLLAEDQVGYPALYAGTGLPHFQGTGFDAAYDWNNSDPNWISKWSFQTGNDQGSTVFNEQDPSKAASDFIAALRYSLNSDDVRPFRYLENNDTPGFARAHDLAQSKFAAATEFLLPGIPLIFYGQEIGSDHATYDLPSYDPAKSIRSYNPALWDYYKKLVALHRRIPALSTGKWIDHTSAQERAGGIVSLTVDEGNDRHELQFDFRNLSVKLDARPLDASFSLSR